MVDPRVVRTVDAVLTAARGLMVEAGLEAITHQKVAQRAGVGRRTVYRHWPTRSELLHDALSGASFPTYEPTGDLAADVRTHLDQLRDALVHGPLAFVVLALGERSTIDPEFAALRARLVDAGCEPLRRVLGEAAQRGDLPGADVEQLVAELEGPLFYLVCVRGEAPSDALLDSLVNRVTALASAAGVSAAEVSSAESVAVP